MNIIPALECAGTCVKIQSVNRLDATLVLKFLEWLIQISCYPHLDKLAHNEPFFVRVEPNL